MYQLNTIIIIINGVAYVRGVRPGHVQIDNLILWAQQLYSTSALQRCHPMCLS